MFGDTYRQRTKLRMKRRTETGRWSSSCLESLLSVPVRRLSNPKDQISHLHIHFHKVCELGYDSFAVRCVMRLANQSLEAEMGPNTETSDNQG